ncbi:MAG TPA: F0F1 ATP synthase subunit A [Candidatus Binataceae bacterium]|nr:F0F1 ATP synthase subunit A [Candidatus Binataceae bacterium]
MPKSVNFLELIGGGKVPEVIVGTWIVMGILIVFGLLARRSLAAAADPVVPDERISVRSIAEVLVEWLDGFVHDVTEAHHWRNWVPFFGTLFMFILFANFFGLIPGMEPPTGDSDLTFALGTICFVYYLSQGIRAQGLIQFLKNDLVGPVWWLFILMVPINLADNLFRPFSLGIRLYANMFADHTVLSIFTGLTKLVVPLAFYALGSIVCIIQAIIFVVLSMSYVRLATGHSSEH